MTPILGFLIVLAVAFAGSLLLSPRLNYANPFIWGIIISGIPYILIGLLLGPHTSNFLSQEILLKLEPLISLALGWVGILFGIQLRWKNLLRFPLNYVLFTSLESLVSFGVILILSVVLFWNLIAASRIQMLQAALILAALGCITSPITIARAISVNKARGRLTHLVQFISGLDAFWGIVAAGVIFALIHPLPTGLVSFPGEWLIVSIAIGAGVGLLFNYLLKGWFTQEEIFLLVLGLVIFTSGIGFYLHVSPIFLNMIVGIVLAQSQRNYQKVTRVLVLAEKPIYLMLLIFAGAMWHLPDSMELLLIFGFIATRYVAKYLGGFVSARTINCAFPVPHSLGNVLTSFGGISLAIAFNYKLFFPDFTGNLVMGVTIIGIIVFDEFSAWSTLRVLRKQGEVT